MAWPAPESATAASDPENPDVLMQLGQRAELDRNLPLAERSLLRAAAISRLYQPRYLLTQFYFRHPNGDRYWTWSRQALDAAYGDAAPLLDLAWRMQPDGDWLWANAIPHRPEIARQYLGFLMGRQQWQPAAMVARHLAGQGTADDRQALLTWCDARLAAGHVRDPRDVWRELCHRKLLPYDPDALVTNAAFTLRPLAAGFDWRPTGTPGVTTSIDRGRLQLAFTGTQPEQCTLIWQYINVEPGAKYVLHPGALDNGLAWNIDSPGRLALSYHRPLGSPRRTDTVVILPPRLTRLQ